MNREAISLALRERYPPDLRAKGIGGAVLVHLNISERGVVTRARARRRRILGFIPRMRPTIYHPQTGEILPHLSWTSEPRLLQIAQEVAGRAVFAAALVDGTCVSQWHYPFVCYFSPARSLFLPDLAIETGVLSSASVL